MFEYGYSLDLSLAQQQALKESKVIKVINKVNYQAICEGLIFAVGEDGLSLEHLAKATGLSLKELSLIIVKIIQKYQSSEYGFELVSFASKFKFLSKKSVFPYLERLFCEYKPDTLSPSALETLAIVAYKQPITRIEIEELRGVNCENILRKLLARNLIIEVGRSEAPGRPILYGTSNEFLDSFSLNDLHNLPELPSYEEEKVSNLYD